MSATEVLDGPTVEVSTGIEVTTRAVERVAVAAATAVPGVTRLEPTLLGTAAAVGRQALDAVAGREAEDGDGVEVRVAAAGVSVRVCLSVAGRPADQVCTEVSRAVRLAVRSSFGVEVAAVRTLVVEVAALPVLPGGSGRGAAGVTR